VTHSPSGGRRARLIANPQAGADRAPEFLPLINERLRTLFSDVDVTMSTSPDDAQHIAARIADESCDAVYVAGGDGTLNSVLRGLAGESLSRLPIGVIPLGTGNDFAKALGLGEEPMAALDTLLQPRVVDVDVGTLNDRPFINTSAGGFIANVSESVSETLKNTTGKLAYLVGGARALLGTEPFSARLIVHQSEATDAPPASLDLQLFAVCNARFIGGGYPIAPDALIDDGQLDVVMVPGMPLLEFLGVLQRLAAGEHPDDPSIVQFRTSSFDLEFSRSVRVNTDGEVLHADRCAYRVRPRAARFFCGDRPQTRQTPREWS
jgi:diacylglycerol kinase (ATP)